MLKWEPLKARAKVIFLQALFFTAVLQKKKEWVRLHDSPQGLEGTMPLQTSAGTSTATRETVTRLHPCSYMLKTRYVVKSLADTEKEDIFLKTPYRLQPARFILFFPALLQTLCLGRVVKCESNCMKLHKCSIWGKDRGRTVRAIGTSYTHFRVCALKSNLALAGLI